VKSIRTAGPCVSLLVGALWLSGCDESLKSVAGPTPDLEPTFTAIMRDVFQTTEAAGRPACVTCHTTIGRATPAGGMSLLGDVAYNNLVNAPSPRKSGAIRVVPGDVANSYLIQKLEGAPGIAGVRMPQNGPYLTTGQIQIIKRWIELGAKNN
jgi:hypothetical protein